MTQSYYSLCHDNLGNYVSIQTSDGQIIKGRIQNVNHTHVYVLPEYETDTGLDYGDQRSRSPQHGRFFPALAIPLAAILGITLIAAAPCFGIGCPPPYPPPYYGPYGGAPFAGAKPGISPYYGASPYGVSPYGGAGPYGGAKAGFGPAPGGAPYGVGGAAPYAGGGPAGAGPFGWTPS